LGASLFATPVRLHDSIFLLDMTGIIGSETGEAMLSRYEDKNFPNRDHRTAVDFNYHSMRLPLTFTGGYQHNDVYTDRFDSLWSRYSHLHKKRMAHSGEGLFKRQRMGMRLAPPAFKAEAEIAAYSLWQAAPFTYTPLYRKGVRGSGALAYAITEASVAAFHITLDDYRLFYDHRQQSATYFTDADWDIGMRSKATDFAEGVITVKHTAGAQPAYSAHAQLQADSIKKKLTWNAEAILYNNGKAGARFNAVWQFTKKMALDGCFAWDVIRAERNFLIADIRQKPVHYHYEERDIGQCNMLARFTDTLGFPFQIEGWVDYFSAPLWENRSIRDGQTYITLDTVADAARWQIGARGSYIIAKGAFSCMLSGGTQRPLLSHKRARLSMPWNAGAYLGWGDRLDPNALYAAASAEIRARTTVSYWNADQKKPVAQNAPAQHALFFRVRFPFQLPCFSKFTNSRLWLEAGPFRLKGPQRVASYPGGNLIGPAIALTANGSIVRRQETGNSSQ